MKIELKLLSTCVALSLTGGALRAQPANPLAIASGFNVDVIANGSGLPSSSVSQAIDTPGAYVLYDASYASLNGLTGAISTGPITAASGDQFAIADAAGLNALELTSFTSGTLNFSSPTTFANIFVLGTGANGAADLNYTLTFAGGITASGSYSLADWYDPGNTGAVVGLGRVDQNTGTYDSFGNVYSLTESAIPIPLIDQSLNLESITFSNASGGIVDASIFAVSGIAPVPEASSMMLGLLGGFGLLLLRRRK